MGPNLTVVFTMKNQTLYVKPSAAGDAENRGGSGGSGGSGGQILDDCKAVYDVNVSGPEGLTPALKDDVCGSWNGSSFEAKGCTLRNVSLNTMDGTWALECECTPSLGKTTTTATSTATDDKPTNANGAFAIVGYTFDQFGRVFAPGAVIQVSVLPLVVATTPIVLGLLAIFMWQTYQTLRKSCVGRRDGGGPNREGTDGGRIGGSNTTSSASSVTPRTSKHGDDDADDDKRTSFVRRARRRVSIDLANEHYVMAVFKGKREPGRGVGAAVAILVFAIECQIMSATLLYYLHSCYTLDSVFADEALDTETWILNRAAIIVLGTLLAYVETTTEPTT